MEIKITVNCNGEFWSGGACFKVPEPFIKTFNPIDICDEPDMASILGGISKGGAEIVLIRRKGVAHKISNLLAEEIFNVMCKNDTLNGYKIIDQ